MTQTNPLLTRYQIVALTLLRVVVSALLMQHGAQKLFGAFGGIDQAGGSVQLLSLMGLAGVLEFFVAALVLLGLLTRPAALVLAGEMAAAYVLGHASHGFWPIANKGELAVAYAVVFLFLSAAGAGPFSLDALLARRRRAGAESMPAAG